MRAALGELGTAGPFGPRPESRGLTNLRSNENPHGGPYRQYPDDGVDVLVRHYLAALDAIEPPRSPSGRRGTWTWTGENVLVTRGAVDALDLILRTFFEPGVDRVAVTPPNFAFFDRLAKTHAIATGLVPLGGERYDRLDVERLVAAPVKGVLLCGRSTRRSAMERRSTCMSTPRSGVITAPSASIRTAPCCCTTASW
ncbi:hypothetical protein AB0K48_44040 [Nonomuraea sp. NPDC055795]